MARKRNRSSSGEAATGGNFNNKESGKNEIGIKSGRKNNDNNNNNQQKKKGPNLKKLSHSLSWALRHAAPQLKLTMTADGYVPVEEILSHNHGKLRGGYSEADIRKVVETSDKQRFKLEERPAELYGRPKGELILCIRANQGHTIKTIDPELLLTKISAHELRNIPTIVHGTYSDPWTKSISKQGLKKMSRNHIHFACGLPKDKGVISGMRKSCQVYIYINPQKCADDNDSVTFFRSDNGVLLTAGIENTGVLPVSYFSHVTDASGKILLDNR